MRQHIHQLARLSERPERRIIGLMSGTSLDGLDVACCRIAGSGRATRVTLEHFTTVPYDDAFKLAVRQVFAQRTIDFQHLVLLNVEIAENFAAIVLDCLSQWNISPAETDLIASHGQTVFHAPARLHQMPGRPDATLQIGDADHLALRTGCITVSDFRQKNIAAGGEGAPLALYGDYWLFSDSTENRLLLNIGGIANFTFLPAEIHGGEVLATDTGPGNTLLDYICRQAFHEPYDRGGAIARQGTLMPELLEIFKQEDFFSQPFPKTTGPEQFGRYWLEQFLGKFPDIPPRDLLSTLTHFTADTIADAVQKLPLPPGPRTIYLSGGGAHNTFLVELLQEKLSDWTFSPISDLGIPVDAKEAVLFAVLANETVAGNNAEKQWPPHLPSVSMGKISFPG